MSKLNIPAEFCKTRGSSLFTLFAAGIYVVDGWWSSLHHFPQPQTSSSLGTLLLTQNLHCDWAIKKHISKTFGVTAQCFVTISYFWLTVPGRLIISWILSACSLWWGLTEGLTGENDVVFSVGITAQVPLRQLQHRYEVYINQFFLGPQGSVGEEKTHRARELSDTEEQMGL